jgi:hypothetical protein
MDTAAAGTAGRVAGLALLVTAWPGAASGVDAAGVDGAGDDGAGAGVGATAAVAVGNASTTVSLS